MKTILWLITARSGSKSIPNKNIKILGKVPLLGYPILACLKTKFSKDVWISTDSPDYVSVANKFGAESPFIRPPELSGDNASSSDVVLHAMNYALSKNMTYDFIGLLEPTSPFITNEIMTGALSLLRSENEASSVVAVKESRPNRKFIQTDHKYLDELHNNIKYLNSFNRQKLSKEITPSGGLYIARWNDFLKFQSFYTEKTLAYEVSELNGLEIDEPIDWDFAEFILEKELVKL